MSRGRHLRKRRKLKKEYKCIFFSVLFMVIFLTYGLWPRDGNVLVNPFVISHSVFSQMNAVLSTNINTLDEYLWLSEQRSASSEDTMYKPYVYDITNDERELLLKLVYSEANTESIECQKAVLQVVFNRLESNNFPNTIHDVIFQSNPTIQFTPTANGALNKATPNKTNELALEAVLKGEVDLPSNVVYFWATYIDTNSSDWFRNMQRNNYYKTIDNINFYYQ
jgi:spore germination cell wall hydrolase CwlJ-like protein